MKQKSFARLAAVFALYSIPVMYSSASATDLNAGLVLHLPLNEGDGTELRNLGATSTAGTASEISWIEDSLRGEGYTLKMKATSSITVPYDPRLSLPDELTLAAWVRLDNYGPYYAKHLIQKWNFPPKTVDTNYSWYLFGNHEGNRPAMEGVLMLHAAHGGENMAAITPQCKLQVGRWHHVAATYHKDRGGQAYVNGVPVAAQRTRARGQLALNEADLKLTFGDGALSDVRIYNRTLSDQEILGLVKDTVQSSALLHEPLDSLPLAATAGDRPQSRLLQGRLPGTRALVLDSGSIKWEIDADGDCFIEFWMRPNAWDAATATDVQLAAFSAGERKYRLLKAGDAQRLLLSSGDTVVQVYPIYNWIEKKGLSGIRNDEQWHYISLHVCRDGVALDVDGIKAQVVSDVQRGGTLQDLRLFGNGTAFSELRIEKGRLTDMRERYLRLHRGDDADLLRIGKEPVY